MYFEDSIAWDKAELQDELDDGYITESEYEQKLSEIEEKESNYYSGW